MTYTKYLLFSILLVSPSMLLSQGMTRRVYRISGGGGFWMEKSKWLFLGNGR